MLPSVRKLGLARGSWVPQHDEDPKHKSKSTAEWLQKKKWTVLNWPATRLHLNPSKNLCRQLKSAQNIAKIENGIKMIFLNLCTPQLLAHLQILKSEI